MGTQERKKRERKLRQEQILNAAISLIEVKGFENITMEEIAERAELSKGTLYLYFNDKYTLYHAIKKRGLKFIRNHFQRIIKEDVPGSKLAKDMMLLFIHFMEDNAAFTKAMLLYENANESKCSNLEISDCSRLEDEILMLITRSIQIGIQDGSIKNKNNPKVLALQIIFQMRGMLLFFIMDDHNKSNQIIEENEMVIDDLVEIFLNTHFKSIENY